jgi:hypothetical protein
MPRRRNIQCPATACGKQTAHGASLLDAVETAAQTALIVCGGKPFAGFDGALILFVKKAKGRKRITVLATAR